MDYKRHPDGLYELNRDLGDFLCRDCCSKVDMFILGSWKDLDVSAIKFKCNSCGRETHWDRKSVHFEKKILNINEKGILE